MGKPGLNEGEVAGEQPKCTAAATPPQRISNLLRIAHFAAEFIPAIVKSAASHVWRGPPIDTWSFKFHVVWTGVRTFLSHEYKRNDVEYMQRHTSRPGVVPKTAKIAPCVIPREKEAAEFMAAKACGLPANVVEMANDVSGMIKGEWIWHAAGRSTTTTDNKNTVSDTKACSTDAIPPPHVANDDTPIIYMLHGGAYALGSIEMSRPVVYNLARTNSACVFGINYRLAPQAPFPCAVIDAISGYIHLIRTCAIPASRIVLAGESAGGGLAIATLLALRDMGLPRPAGAILLSPWVDLTHSFPSYELHAKWDYLPGEGTPVDTNVSITGTGHGVFTKSNSDVKNHATLNTLEHDETMTDVMDLPPPSDTNPQPQRHFYAPDGFLDHPFVSPIWAHDLSGLPPLLIQVGSVERLYDECVSFAQKIAAANSETGCRFSGVSNNMWCKDPSSSFVRLEIYKHQVHVFHIFGFLESTRMAFENTDAFVRQVIGQVSRPNMSTCVWLDHRGHLVETNELKPRL